MQTQARRVSSSSVLPPSSPPSVLHYQDGLKNTPSSPAEARGVPSSPAQSLWNATPSPTQTLANSSPELPPLATLSALPSFPRTPLPDREQADNASYFTASWGSPYQHPPPSFNRELASSPGLGSDDLEDSSNLQFGLDHLLPRPLEENDPLNQFSLEHLLPRPLEENDPRNQFSLEHLLPRPLEEDDSPGRFNLDHLLPRPLDESDPLEQFNLEHLIPSRIANSLQTPTKGTPRSKYPTEEWVRQFLEGRWNREANSWFSGSDTSGESDSASTSGTHLEPEDKKAKSHKTRKSNKTLNQQDFWAHFSKSQKEELGKMMASRFAPEGETDPSQKPASEQSKLDDKPLPSPPVEAPNGSLKPEEPAPVKPHTPPPRPRKKVMVKGKGCIISIAKDIPRGTPGYPPKPMSAEEVDTKMKELERAGFDIRGWRHEEASTASPPQARIIWPDEDYIRTDRAVGHKVRVPNKAEWDAYVQHLMEAKLAALGVSLGGDEEEAPISRQGSVHQAASLFSPPLPTSSAGSQRMRQGSISTFPLGPSPGHQSRQSMASPMSFSNPRTSMHMHRHSTFSPASFLQNISPSGTWSPGNYFGTQSASGGSPALPLNRPDLAEGMSPVSPFNIRPGQQLPQKDDLFLQMQQQQQQLQAQLLLQQQQQLLGLRPNSTLAEVPEDEAEQDEVPSMNHAGQPGPDIAVPMPRGHRHNISDNLEREARNAEYHLERAIDKQFDEGGDFSTEPETSKLVANSAWEGAVLHQPQPHNRAHSLAKPQQSVSFGLPAQQPGDPRENSDGARTNISDVTNPSLIEGDKASGDRSRSASNSWRDSRFSFGNSGSAMHSKHTSKSSLSKLNVEAKEFKFNPGATFSPASSTFAFSSGTKPGFEAPAPNSFDGVASFNASAPAFKPDAPVFKPTAPTFTPQAPVFKPAVPAFNPLAKPMMPTSGFNFAAPAFKPDAPAFNPGSAEFKPSEAAPATTSSKIFGDVNISASDVVKPARRSKAVPIIRPDLRPSPPRSEEAEDKEDESGRPMQPDGREKRARHTRDDGDAVPKFALQPILPSQPLGEKRGQAAQQDTRVDRATLADGKENLSPEIERAVSKSKSPEPLSLQDMVAGAEANIGTPHVEKSTEMLPGTPIDNRTPRGSDAHESDAATPTAEEVPETSEKKHGHKSSLSATAKPFEFHPGAPGGYEFGLHVTRPSNAHTEDFDNQFASPPRWDNRSPATTFRPSDDGSFRTALETRRRAPYPESESGEFDLGQMQFNDIDAVMQHMNEEGSDFGVERDDNWDQSPRGVSPARDFGRTELRPDTNMRSHAPSPSPRRLYARNMVASSTSVNQDAFDSERAGVPYETPVRLNNAEEVPMSDWDEGLPSGEEEKIHTRSKFFDNHVDHLLGRLLQARLGPLENNIQDIQDSLTMLSQRNSRGRRSISTTERLDSDADDEDDGVSEPHYRNRSPRKDRRMEKIRTIIKEALETHQQASAPVPVSGPEADLPAKIRDVVVEAIAAHQPSVAPAEYAQPENIRDIIMDALAHHQPQWTPPKFEPVPAEQMKAIVEEVVLAHQPPPVVESIKPEDVRSIVTEVLAANVPQATQSETQPLQSGELRSLIAEAMAEHAPKATPTIIEPIQPDTIRSIITETLASNQPPAPSVPEIVQPDMIRAIVEEALASHKPARALEAPIDIPQPQIDLSEIYQVIGSLKASIAQTTSNNLHAEDIREILEEAFKRQSTEVAKREETQAMQEKDDRIADLEAMLKEASTRLADEVDARQELEAREEDRARLLRVTEEELALLRESASDDENTIRALKEECDAGRHTLDVLRHGDSKLKENFALLQGENEELKLKIVALQSSEADVAKKLDAVTAENEALTFTLEEHRISADKWRNEIQQAHQETEKLRKAIEQSRFQADEAARVREGMRAKFEKLSQDMVVASRQVAVERTQWQKSDEEHMKKYEVLSARIEAEARTRERLEKELERLETQEREGMKQRITLEQTQKHNAKLEEMIDQLKEESLENHRLAEKYQRDYREARETGHFEIRRTRTLLEAEIEAANNQVNIVRADLEAEINRLRSELDNVRMDADTAKARHELELEAASDAKKNAVNEAYRSNTHALQEQQQAFERRLEHVSQDHARALQNAREDKDRAEAYLKDRLSIADSRMEHLNDRIALLEEKLSIAKEAASAAAAAAQSAKSPPAAAAAPSYASGAAEKISPQALRESIVVLQEQLQERELRIESLEQQLAEVDTDAPDKVKERDTEIGWLRELLGVRIDDINDLINALAQPTFDRETVRDAAIRIRTNLQMEQQEKERLISGGNGNGTQNFPTLATISNFASPKAVQLAAAFGNWRKRGETASSNLASASKASSSTDSSRNHTPSRIAPPSAHSFLSGLMTPPTSNARRTPGLPSSNSNNDNNNINSAKPTRPSNTRSASNSSRSSRASTSTVGGGASVIGFPSLGKQPVPSTPPLMRKTAYDQDAEDAGFNESGFYDDESTVDGDVTPIALKFGHELARGTEGEVRE